MANLGCPVKKTQFVPKINLSEPINPTLARIEPSTSLERCPARRTCAFCICCKGAGGGDGKGAAGLGLSCWPKLKSNAVLQVGFCSHLIHTLLGWLQDLRSHSISFLYIAKPPAIYAGGNDGSEISCLFFSPKSRLREETKNGRHQSKVGSLPVTQTIQTETCERRDYHFRVKQTGRQQTGRTSVRALGMAAAPSWPPTFTTALEKGLQLQNWTQQRAPWPRGCAPHLEAPDDSIAQRPSGHGTEASRLECSNYWHKLLAPEQLRAVDECSPEW